MKNYWLDSELTDLDLIKAEYNTQVVQEKNEIRDVLDKYKNHCWFNEFMYELGFRVSE